MNINKKIEDRKAPFSVVVLDMMDRYYYADVVDEMGLYKKLDDYGKAIALADALFVINNYGWEDLQAMNNVDGGYDVRVYNSDMACIYAAHEKYKDTWIGKSSSQVAFTAGMQKAIRFSIKTHEVYQKQKRKGKDIPYITHPLTVGLILARAGASMNVIMAGILHDTIEDSVPEKKVTKEMLAERFGGEVAALVDSVTEKNRETLSWNDRKRAALAHIADFSHESLLVKSADTLANTNELLEDYKKDGDAVFDRFNAPDPKKENILKNSIHVIDAILGGWQENPLAGDLVEVRIQLTRILALGSGPLAYIKWTTSFVEYETEAGFPNSRVRSEVLKLCEAIHQTLREFDDHNDSVRMDTEMRKSLSVFHEVVKDVENDEKELGMHMLLLTHLADIMASLKMLKSAGAD